MRVFNESGQKVPFPDATWTVVSGEATLVTSSDSDGATARVQFGLTPGPVVVRAQIESLVATFNLTATPPVAASIRAFGGEGQTVQVGQVSEPLVVEVREIDNLPATGGFVEFSGPASVRFHPLDEGPPANPLIQVLDINGRAGARVELLGITHTGEANQKAAAAPVMVTATAGATVFYNFVIDVLGRTPEFTADSLVNGATFTPGIVPGSIATLFGVGLSEGITGTEAAGGATSYKGTTVRIGGIAAPLLSVTRGETEQINLQAPFEIPTGQTATVEVDNNGSIFSAGGVPVFGAQPGVFRVPFLNTSVPAVVNATTFALITPENPAPRNATLAIFFTGGGLLSRDIDTGELGPVPPLEMALPVSIVVDTRQAEVSFKGYAPGLLGVYQGNFTIPEQARCGERGINVIVAGTPSPSVPLAIQCP
jgi:uncharacterized protein (TIGR03437 family)